MPSWLDWITITPFRVLHLLRTINNYYFARFNTHTLGTKPYAWGSSPTNPFLAKTHTKPTPIVVEYLPSYTIKEDIKDGYKKLLIEGD